ncbi:MAG: O-antigen ligase family protein [Candidatus Levybacteria bacterium]|nr:O-antigen ligase family protein [Candidatus Levybacteria bacterium]
MVEKRRKMDMIQWFFVIFLGTFSFGELIRLSLGNNFFIKPVDIASIVLVLIWISKVFKSWKKIILNDKLFIPIILFIAIAFISLVINFKNFSFYEMLVAFSYFLRWILYVTLFFVVKSFSSKFKEKIMYLLLALGTIFVALGFVQYFFYSNLRNLYYLGWDEHMYRLFSTFLDPNFAGAFFVLYSIFLLGILLYFREKNSKNIWLIMPIFALSIVSIFLTYSRSGLIMFLTSIAIFSILSKKIYLFLAVLLVLAVFVLISSRSFNIENINLFRIASAEARIESAKTAIQIIKKNMFFGVGFNTYRYAQIKYGFRSASSSSTSHADAGTDNSFLFVFATMGIVGLIIYLNLIWNILKKAYANFKKQKANSFQKYISIVVLSSVGGIIVDSFFINSLFYSFIVIWIWILLGLIENN